MDIKKINNRWFDERGNNWSDTTISKERAEKLSASLINCTDCSDCSYCSYCTRCSYCSDCSRCSYCSGCSGCSDFKTNPQRYTTGSIGSRKAQTTFYWDKDQGQVVCGCFVGTISEFEQRVKYTHADNKFAKEYFKEIKKVKALMK